jgi:cysteine desulfurase
MNDNLIYLDYNATTPLNIRVSEAMTKFQSLPLNASSVHNFGRKAKSLIEQARLNIAKVLGIIDTDNYKITFTSSGSEANNLIINSFKNSTIAISTTEHASIINPVKNYNYKFIEVNKEGIIDLNQLENILINNPDIKLISIIMANNETGVIQDIKSIADIVHKYGVLLHSDLIQAIGKISINIEELGIDIATISAHKFGGPTGAACLISKKNIQLIPQIFGGGQEQGARAGTENCLAIIGFGEAALMIEDYLEKNIEVRKLRDYLEEQLSSYAIVIGKGSNRLPNTSCLIMSNVSSETQVINFDLQGIYVSAGSACSSGKISISHVLTAYGYDNTLASCAIRISLGIDTTKQHIDSFIKCWLEIYKRLTENERSVYA